MPETAIDAATHVIRTLRGAQCALLWDRREQGTSHACFTEDMRDRQDGIRQLYERTPTSVHPCTADQLRHILDDWQPDADRADKVAADLHARLSPETVVVTLGRLGALGYSAAGTFRVPAP